MAGSCNRLYGFVYKSLAPCLRRTELCKDEDCGRMSARLGGLDEARTPLLDHQNLDQHPTDATRTDASPAAHIARRAPARAGGTGVYIIDPNFARYAADEYQTSWWNCCAEPGGAWLCKASDPRCVDALPAAAQCTPINCTWPFCCHRLHWSCLYALPFWAERQRHRTNAMV